MATVFGAATIKVNGKAYDTNKGAKLRLGGFKGATKNHSKGRAGTQYEFESSRIECSVPVVAGLSLDEIRNIKGATVSFVMDTGQMYTIGNADHVESTESDDESGNVTFALEGDAAEETGV